LQLSSSCRKNSAGTYAELVKISEPAIVPKPKLLCVVKRAVIREKSSGELAPAAISVALATSSAMFNWRAITFRAGTKRSSVTTAWTQNEINAMEDKMRIIHNHRSGELLAASSSCIATVLLMSNSSLFRAVESKRTAPQAASIHPVITYYVVLSQCLWVIQHWSLTSLEREIN
jgi:hypothetical protein